MIVVFYDNREYRRFAVTGVASLADGLCEPAPHGGRRAKAWVCSFPRAPGEVLPRTVTFRQNRYAIERIEEV